MKERNTTLETTDHNNRNNSENIKETPDERIPGKLIGAIVAVGSLAFIGILTETVMTVLFPQLMREFNVNTATVQWITTIYLLTVAATMPLSSYLNRKFKHRVLFLAAVALAVLGSLTMIFGHAFPVILVARIIQGIGSGVATPLMMNIILEQSPRSKVGRLMGVGSLVITVAPAIGPTVGGAVSSILPWRAIFVIVIPVILLISLPVGLKCIEQHRPTEEAHLNPLQFAAIVLALCGLVMFLNQAGVAVAAAISGGAATAPAIFAVISLIVGLGSLFFFGWSSRRSFSPLIRLGWLRDPMVLLHLIAYMLLPIVGIGFGYVITNLAQLSLGTNAFLAGALVLPGALIGAFFAPIGGTLYDRFGPVPDSGRVLPGDLRPDPAAGLLHAADAGHACRFLLHLRTWLCAWLLQHHDQCVAQHCAAIHAGWQRRVQHLPAVRWRSRNRAVLHGAVRGPGRRRQGRNRGIQPCHGGWRQLDVHRHDRDCRRCNLLPDYRLPHRRETQITVFSPSASPLWAQFCSPSLRSGRL